MMNIFLNPLVIGFKKIEIIILYLFNYVLICIKSTDKRSHRQQHEQGIGIIPTMFGEEWLCT